MSDSTNRFRLAFLVVCSVAIILAASLNPTAQTYAKNPTITAFGTNLVAAADAAAARTLLNVAAASVIGAGDPLSLRQVYMTPSGNGVGRSGYGDDLSAANGSETFREATASDGPAIIMWETPAGTAQRRRSGGNIYHFTLTPTVKAKIKLDSTSGVRTWIGICNKSIGASTWLGSADPASAHLVGFRYDDGAGDTTWRACTKDGSTLQSTDTGQAVGTTLTTLSFACSSTAVIFYINGTAYATNTTRLPNTTEAMYFMIGLVPSGSTTNGIAWTQYIATQAN